MVNQLKTIQLCQVVNLLKATRKSADILKALFNKLIDEKSEDVLMKLTNWYLACFFENLLSFLKRILLEIFILVKAKKTDMVRVFVI